MDNKDQPTTKFRWSYGSRAAAFTICPALGIYVWFIQGEETLANWIFISSLPFAIYQWVVFIRGVDSLSV